LNFETLSAIRSLKEPSETITPGAPIHPYTFSPYRKCPSHQKPLQMDISEFIDKPAVRNKAIPKPCGKSYFDV
jgi:hypothetical protein